MCWLIADPHNEYVYDLRTNGMLFDFCFYTLHLCQNFHDYLSFMQSKQMLQQHPCGVTVSLAGAHSLADCAGIASVSLSSPLHLFC